MLHKTKSRTRTTGRLFALEPLVGQLPEFILLKENVSIGSEQANDFAVQDASVSRRHAIIRARSGRYVIRDLESTNGTFVNGRRVNGSAELERGDELRLGSVRFVVAAPDRGTVPLQAPTRRRRWSLSGHVLTEIVLLAFVIGFGSAQYLAYLMYSQQNQLLLGKAVPIETAPPPAAKFQPPLAPPARIVAAPASPLPQAASAATPVAIASAAPAPPATAIPKPNSDEATHQGDIVAGAVSLASLIQGSGSDAGQLAPDFDVLDLSGQNASLGALRGNIIFLNVWATWCPVCRAEMPAIQKLYQVFRNFPDFRLIAVSVDKNPAAVGPFIKQNAYQFPVLLDPENRVGSAYGVRGLPSTFIIDGNGRVIWNWAGGLDWSSAQLQSAVRRLL